MKGIDNLQDIGCFGLTELGYGNNAVEMETTAIYDAKTKEFIVNTPHPLAQKYWITNGAVHAKHVVVMAKLIVDGKYFFFSKKKKNHDSIPEFSPTKSKMTMFIFFK